MHFVNVTQLLKQEIYRFLAYRLLCVRELEKICSKIRFIILSQLLDFSIHARITLYGLVNLIQKHHLPANVSNANTQSVSMKTIHIQVVKLENKLERANEKT